MQIKTLAEILAEENQADHSSSSKTANIKKSKQAKSHHTATDNFKKHPVNSKKTVEKSSYQSPSASTTNIAAQTTNIQKTRLEKVMPNKVKLEAANIKNTKLHTTKPIAAKSTENKEAIVDTTDSLQRGTSDIITSTNLSNETPNTRSIDNLTCKLQPVLKTVEQRQAEIDEIKADGRLRWLAFYYLSTREHSAKELKDKLLAKDQNPQKIDDLLAEFSEKGYQSDMRTALMLIREGIRKGRGRNRIKQDFYKRKIELPNNIDELIDMANAESAEFIDLAADNTNNFEQNTDAIDWLKLAVQARIKKYGNDIPTEQRDKAKQLRFLQYRGFTSDICFAALTHDLTSLAEDFY